MTLISFLKELKKDIYKKLKPARFIYIEKGIQESRKRYKVYMKKKDALKVVNPSQDNDDDCCLSVR